MTALEDNELKPIRLVRKGNQYARSTNARSTASPQTYCASAITTGALACYDFWLGTAGVGVSTLSPPADPEERSVEA